MKKLIICFTTLLLVAACMEEPEPVEVSSVTITPELLEIIVGETQTLTATVLPENATDKIVTWTTSDESIVTVNDGKLNAVAPGTATITAKAGDRTATCKVTVSAATTGVEKGYEWVDLGLPSGLKWATCNVGASAPEDYGDYFAWGEAEPYYTVGHSQDSPCHNWKEGKIGYNWLSYKFRISGDKYGIDVKFSKYNTYDKYGTIDNKTTLELVDDAARANWGGSWRMPTDDEWTELITKCTWILTIQNGINGRLVTGPNGNSIFLPTAGVRNDLDLLSAGSVGDYWSSSLDADYPYFARFVVFGSGDVGSGGGGYRYLGFSVRPVTDDGVRVSVSGISLDQDAITLVIGKSASLKATVVPANATQPAVIWSSSNTEIATVNKAGRITAIADGSATITATTFDGGKTAACSVTVSSSTAVGGYEWVDLGLPSGLKWATHNVGASEPEDYGDYFAWGETEPYYTVGHSQDSPCHNWKEGKIGYNWLSYKFRISGDKYGIDVKFSKYNTYDKYGAIDNKTTLELVDDAARANWGGSWRMPTDDEWAELITKCTWILTIQNGINGRLVTGPNGNSIFLPDAGNRGDTGLSGEGSLSKYWSSSLAADYPYGAMLVYGVSRLPSLRFDGCSVRPVTE